MAVGEVDGQMAVVALRQDDGGWSPHSIIRVNVADHLIRRVVDLSNVSPEMLDAAVQNVGISALLDAVLSVEVVVVYKPHPKVYQYAVDQLGIKPGEIAFQSPNAWDAHAASLCGMRVIWCNRYRQRLPGLPDFEIASLAELPDLVA
jgi:2-haloacid dehalogenase